MQTVSLFKILIQRAALFGDFEVDVCSHLTAGGVGRLFFGYWTERDRRKESNKPSAPTSVLGKTAAENKPAPPEPVKKKLTLSAEL